MNIYLDNAAACKPLESAMKVFAETSVKYFANQEAIGGHGTDAAKAVAQAGKFIADKLAPGFSAFFVNTGTDALRMAVSAVLKRKEKPFVITTKAEHPALLKALEQSGSEIAFLPLTSSGDPDTNKLKELLSLHRTALFAIHHVNAETGKIQEVSALHKILKETSPDTVFLLDSTQSVCKIPVPAGPDFLTLSGCKIGAPGGAVLLCRPELSRQVTAIRAADHAVGRCVPALALSIAEAVKDQLEHAAENLAKVQSLASLTRELLSEAVFTLPEKASSPWIVHALFPGKEAAILVRMLAADGISVSPGSACSSETKEPSHVLKALGFSDRKAYSAMRISFSAENTEEEIKSFAECLQKSLKNY